MKSIFVEGLNLRMDISCDDLACVSEHLNTVNLTLSDAVCCVLPAVPGSVCVFVVCVPVSACLVCSCLLCTSLARCAFAVSVSCAIGLRLCWCILVGVD